MTQAVVSERLETHGNTHAAADAERGEALPGTTTLHLEQERVEDAGAGCADRMADRDRTAVDIDDGRIPAEVLVDGACLRREGLVRLDQIEIASRPAGLFQRLA